MVRTGPKKTVDGDAWRGRLNNARAFKRAATELEAKWEEGANGQPIVVLIVLAAIGYGDALSARFGNTINQKDHRALPATIRNGMGARADAKQLERLKAILDEKDAASYGARIGRMAEARARLVQLERFAQWVETTITGA